MDMAQFVLLVKIRLLTAIILAPKTARLFVLLKWRVIEQFIEMSYPSNLRVYYFSLNAKKLSKCDTK